MKLYEQIGIIWYFKISAMKQQPVMFNFTVPFHLNFWSFVFSYFPIKLWLDDEAFWGTKTMKCVQYTSELWALLIKHYAFYVNKSIDKGIFLQFLISRNGEYGDFFFK